MYDALEQSTQSGSPVELYTFLYNNATYFRYCTGSESITVGLDTFTPVSISRETLLISSEQRTQALNVIVPASDPFAALYALSVPAMRSNLTIQRLHRTDTDQQVIQVFSGGVSAVSFTEKDGLAQIAVLPLTGSLSRTVPRYTFQSLCNHILFDRWCKISAAAYNYAGTVGTITTGVVFNVTGLGAAKGDHWADGGYMLFGSDYRLILSQVGDLVTLLIPFYADITAASVSVYAGCDHSLNACKNKFSNSQNFGGYPFIPNTNPFQTGI